MYGQICRIYKCEIYFQAHKIENRYLSFLEILCIKSIPLISCVAKEQYIYIKCCVTLKEFIMFENLHSRGQISRDRIVVSTLRCGRNNPGSNPGHGNDQVLYFTLRYQLLNLLYGVEHCIKISFRNHKVPIGRNIQTLLSSST